MVKRKIEVNANEAKLIKILNEKIKSIKSEDKLIEEANTIKLTEKNIEPDSEPETVSTGKKVFVYDDVEPETVSNTEPDPNIEPDDIEPDWKRWENIESDLQRQLKFNSYKDKGYANACPNNSWSHKIMNTDYLIKVLGPQISDMLKRVNDIDTVLDDNASCRQTIDKECGNPIFDESNNIVYDKPISDEFKKVLNNSKKISDEIKHIKNSSNKKTMSNGVEYVINDILSPKKDLALITDEYEMVDHPQHYNNYEYEVIDMMRKIYGDEKTAIFCELNAFKYRMRMGTKPTSPIDEDLKKEQWYLKKKQEILNNKIIIKTDKGTL